MIKLKSIVKEILDEVTWKTPPGTPDPVIDVIHRLTAKVLNRFGEHAKLANYIQLKYEKKYGWIIANLGSKDLWMIYNPERGGWFAPDRDEKGNLIIAPLPENQLNNVISSWMV